jgi:hypothetical protein
VPCVASISVTPVKSLGLLHPHEIELTEVGVPGRVRVGDLAEPL